MSFNIEIPDLPLDEKERGAAVMQLRKENAEFASKKLGRKPIDNREALARSGQMSPLEVTMHHLYRGTFWDVIKDIDGSIMGDDHVKPQTPAQRREARVWAQATFTESELQQLFQLTVRAAVLMDANDTGLPGGLFGHTTLYKDLYEKSGSMFKDAFRDEQVARLNNGRFWEQLPDMTVPSHRLAIETVRAVLGNHSDDLNPDFAPTGLKIYWRNRKDRNSNLPFNLAFLDESELDKYIGFIDRIDSQLEERDQFREEDLDELVAPYVREIISTVYEGDFDTGVPKYGVHKHIKTPYFSRLEASPVAWLLENSERIKDVVAREVGGLLEEEISHHFAEELLSNLPNGPEIFYRGINKLFPNPQRDAFLKNLDDQGFQIPG